MVSGGMQVRAQMSAPPPSPPLGTKEDPAKAMDGLLSSMEFQVVGAAKAMPADKYSFAPAQGIFTPGQATQFDTVRNICGAGDAPGAGELLVFRLERH